MSMAIRPTETSMEAPVRSAYSGSNILRRAGGLLARAGVLALGLSLGGVGPVLGSTFFGSGTPVSDLQDEAGFVIPISDPITDLVTDANAFRVEAPVSGGPISGGDRFREVISDPVLWGEWRLFTAGREQLIGFGVLHPGAKPAMMKKRARTLELRLYVQY